MIDGGLIQVSGPTNEYGHVTTYRDVLDEVQPHWAWVLPLITAAVGVMSGASASKSASMQQAAAGLQNKQQGAKAGQYQPTARMFEQPGAGFGGNRGMFGGSSGGTNVLRPNDISGSALGEARADFPSSPASAPAGQAGGTSTPGVLNTEYQRKSTYGYDPSQAGQNPVVPPGQTPATAGNQPPAAGQSNWVDNAQAAVGLAQSLSAMAQGPELQGGGIPQAGPSGYQPSAASWYQGQKRRYAGF
jgi:hypothetical protein